jgi:NADPH:quinone reductase
MKSFLLFNQPASAWTEAWTVITELLKSGQVKPIVAKIFSLEDATEALRYLIEGRPFGRVLVNLASRHACPAHPHLAGAGSRRKVILT